MGDNLIAHNKANSADAPKACAADLRRWTHTDRVTGE